MSYFHCGSRAAILGAVAALLVGGFAPARAADEPPADWRQRLERLEGRQKILEERLEALQAKSPPPPAGTAVAAANATDGFTIRSADERFMIRIGGYLQADSRTYVTGRAPGNPDQILLRSARLIFESVVHKYMSFYFMPDFGQGKVVLQDAYMDWNYFPHAQLRIGKFRPGFGLERIQRDRNLAFTERALPTGLAPNRDVGVQLQGDALNKVVGYSAGVFNGAVDGGISDGDSDSNKDFIGRVFFSPLADSALGTSHDLGLGFAADVGAQRGSAAASGLSSYVTDDQQTFLAYIPGVVAAGKRMRLSPQGYWYHDRFGFLAEYVSSAQGVERVVGRTTNARWLRNSAWQAQASWVLTGERAAYVGVKPSKPFDPKAGTWGAWEVVARYDEFWADPDAFPIYATSASSSRGVRAWTGGLNWYPNLNSRVMLDWEQANFVGGARVAGGALMTRVQVSF